MIGHCDALGTLSALGPWLGGLLLLLLLTPRTTWGLGDGDGDDDLDDDLDGVAAVVLVVGGVPWRLLASAGCD